MRERIEPPAAAWAVVMASMGDSVATAYLAKPPPTKGVRLSVTGRQDGKVTQWDVDEQTARVLELRLRAHPKIARVGVTAYDTSGQW